MPYWHNQTHVLKLGNNHSSNTANDWDNTLQISLFIEKTDYEHAYQNHAGWEAALNTLQGLFSASEVQQTPDNRNAQILPAARQLQSQQWVTGMQNPRPLPLHAAPQKPEIISWGRNYTSPPCKQNHRKDTGKEFMHPHIHTFAPDTPL